MAVRLPRLLNADFSEKTRLHPVAMSLSMKLRETSTAEITLDEQDADVAIHDWVEIYTPQGSAGLFRVTDISHNILRERVLTLRHGIDTLCDGVYKAQMDYDGTVAEFLGSIMAQQTVVRWQLGTCEDTSAYARQGINYDQLSGLLWALADERNGYYLTYDFTTIPWTVNYLALPTEPACEFRLSRNVQTVGIDRNDDDLCTRLYLSVNTAVTGDDGITETQTELQIHNNAAAQAIYGIVEKTADIDTENVADVSAWVQRYMDDHAAPTIQISIDGYELAELTGDTWDEYDRGKLARVAMPSVGETILERVVTVNYPDLLGDPEHVEVELANRLDSVSSTLAQLEREARQAARGARGAARSGVRVQEVKNIATTVEGNVDDIDKIFIKTAIDRLTANETLYSRTADNADGISTLNSKTGIASLGTGETLYSNIQKVDVKVGAVPSGSNLYGLYQGQESSISTINDKTGIGNLGTGETLYGNISTNASSISTLNDKTGIGSLATGETLYSRTANNASDISTLDGKVGSVPSGSNLYSLHQSNAGSISTLQGKVQTLETNTSGISKDGDTTVFQHLKASQSFELGQHSGSWLSQYVLTSLTITMPSITLSTQMNFVAHISGAWDWDHLTAVTNSRVVTGYTAGSVTGPSGKTIYYLGYETN